MIFLASSSPRRKTLLKKAGIRFSILKPCYEEDDDLKGLPSKIVRIHALKKAESCVGQIKDGIILSADTIVYLRGKIIGKPKDMNEARRILKSLQGNWHTVYTGVAIFKVVGIKILRTIFFEKTKVFIKRLTTQEINQYFKKVNPLDKAGAYAIQSRHGGIVQKIQGLYSNAVGLPIEKVIKSLMALQNKNGSK